MSKQLYEEALADVNKVKEIAEDNAKRAIIEAVVPRIRDLIEKQLLGESLDDEDILNDDSDTATLNLDALASDPGGAPVGAPEFGSRLPKEDEEYEMNSESVGALDAMSESHEDFESQLSELAESVSKFTGASKLLRESKGYQSHITQMIANVENMYEYVQGSVADPKKSAYEAKLETLFQDLNTLQESTEMSKNKKLNEEDVTLKLTGLPDEIDLDSIGVDLITGDEEGEGDELALDGGDDMDGDMDGGDQGGDDVDFQGMGDEGQDDTQFEGDELSDDTVVEIDERMLRTEIAKMRKIREEKMGADEFDDFGGGHDEGDQFVDGEVRTEGVEDDEEVVDEVTTSLTTSNRAMHEDDGDGDMPMAMESLKHKLALETKLILRAKARATKIKEAMATARSKKNLKLEGSLRKDLALAVNRINEATARHAKVKGQLAKATGSLNETRENRGSRPADKTADSLRKKLAEANLFNVKLRYSNKLLQNENLSAKQKSQVLGQLDEAKTEREAKLVYESLTRTMSPKNLREGSETRQVLGSSSRATRPASTQIVNEGAGGFDLDRWTKLAGIK
jgi:hypothetical protein